jgi:PAS domain S-box-containing protein
VGWLIPAIIANLTGTVVLCLVYTYLYHLYRKKFLGTWALSWGLFSIRFVFELAAFQSGPSILYTILNQGSTLLSGLLLLWGTYQFNGQKIPFPWLVASLLGVVWILASAITGASFLIITAPSYTLLAVLNLWTGVLILRLPEAKRESRWITGGAFILWGIHKLDFPFLRPVAWFSPWGFLLGALMELPVAFGLMVLYFERLLAEQDQTAILLRASQEKYRQLFDMESDAVFLVSRPRGSILEANAAAERLYGYSHQELVQLGHRDLSAQADRSSQSLRDGEQHIPLRWHRKKDGSSFPVEVTASYFTWKGEEVQLATVRDISERLRTQKGLAINQTMIDRASVGVLRAAPDGRIAYANDTACQMYGFSRQELQSMTIHHIYPPLTPAILQARWQELQAAGALTFEADLERRDSSRLPVQFHANLVRYEDDEYLVVFIQDITERNQAVQALADERAQLASRVEERTAELSVVNQQLAKALRLKDDFLAGMSHELRTPLTAILALSEALQAGVYGAMSERQILSVHQVEESGRHLLALINDILDLSKLEAGQLQLALQPLMVDSVCQASLRMVRQNAQKKHLTISQTIDSSIGPILADERRMKQILANLLSNAVKFTPDGGSIGLEVRGDAQQNQIFFCVWDTGIGISAEDAGRLFQPFVQIDSSLSRKYGGTGLGLSLVLRMAELHGGGVTLESQVGKGSRFTVTIPWRKALLPGITSLNSQGLPILPASDSPDLRAFSAPYPGALLLLAEDNDLTASTLADYLRALNYQVSLVKNGADALQQARQQQPALILMDIQMPILDGLEATRRLRNEPATAGIPVIAITALVMPGDRQRCLEAGANEYISKPIHLEALAQLILSLLSSG